MDMESLYFVINPTAAGGRTNQLWPEIAAYLDKLGLSFNAAFTTAPGEATQMARQAVAQGHGTVVAVGGDGTINEVVNGLISPGEKKGRARLGMIITGRGSDLGRTIGVPSDPEAACERLAQPRTMPLDLGLTEFTVGGKRQSRFFINVAGIGFDAAAVERANRSFRRMKGTIPYLSALLLTLISWRNRAVEIVLDSQAPIQTKIYLVAVGNGQYYGGGMRIAPDADPNDGLFDVCIGHDFSKIEFLKLVPRVYEGTHVTHPEVTMHKAQRVEVRSEYPLASQVDGEIAGIAPLTFEVVPQALEIVV
jgi:YegS/Rv2252/BmrU family lipid kinase